MEECTWKEFPFTTFQKKSQNNYKTANCTREKGARAHLYDAKKATVCIPVNTLDGFPRRASD